MMRRILAMLLAACAVAWGGAGPIREPVRPALAPTGAREPASALRGNWARRQPPALKDGDVVRGINLSQARPGTVLRNLVGKRVTFERCNLVNVRIDRVWTVKRCNVAQVVIPPEPTEKERLIAERDRCVAERAELAAKIAKLQEQIDAIR